MPGPPSAFGHVGRSFGRIPVPKAVNTVSTLNLSFHIARQSGLEFVFSSGSARAYPRHTHVSVYTVTLIRRAWAHVQRPWGARHYPAGAAYVDGPNEAHSPVYGDGFDLVSLCLKKEHFRPGGCPTLLDLCLDRAQPLLSGKILSSDDIGAILKAVESIFRSSRFSGRAAVSDGPIGLRDRKEGSAGNRESELSAFHYIRRFKKESGLTPHQYLIQSRVRLAKHLLTPGCSIAEIAGQSGFYDQSHLNRCFKKSIGLSPAQFIKARHYLD